MSHELKISPSILAADFSILGEQIAKAEAGGAEYLHLDIMDGRFVPNFTFGAVVIKPLRKKSNLFFDAHLMVERPLDFVNPLKDAGADNITVHYEALHEDTERALSYIHSLGMKAGLAVSPDTDVDVIRPYIGLCDMVLIMSVYPGFGGQKFIEKSIERIQRARSLTRLYDTDIEVDGGVGVKNIKRVVDAGANVIVAGSAVFGADDIAKAVSDLKAAALGA